MTNLNPREQELRRAWAKASGDGFAARLARKSLEASARQNPELASVLFDIQNESQSELDVHLTGETIHGHEADAVHFADLVRGIADAVKAVSKQAIGRQHMSSPIHILAPSPGSVRVVLKAAAPRALTVPMPETDTPNQHSRSLEVVANVLSRAGNDGDGNGSDVLSGMAAALPAKAHAGLRRAAKAIISSNWVVDGELRRPLEASLPLHLTRTSANVLLDALDEQTTSDDVLEYRGHVDGQRRSVGAMWFLPEGSAAFEAAIVDPDLIDEVAILSASDARVAAVFNVNSRVGRGMNARPRRTYALVSIALVPPSIEPLV